jgi:hypothetical protein
MKQTFTSDGCAFQVTTKGNKGKITAAAGYCAGVDVLAKVTNTGNGYVFKFPAFSSMTQDNYVCLKYDEAEYIRLLLNSMMDTTYEASPDAS